MGIKAAKSGEIERKTCQNGKKVENKIVRMQSIIGEN